jgi:hypothetical protein
MRRNMRLSRAATVYIFLLLASHGIAMSQEASKDVDTGVIFTAQQVERSPAMNRMFDGMRPLWTPSPEEVALLEDRLKPYLEGVATPQAKEIAQRLGSYKRQYFGYTFGGKRGILVNAFCNAYWKRNDSWRDSIVDVLDGGSCYFQVFYDTSSSQFVRLAVNGPA